MAKVFNAFTLPWFADDYGGKSLGQSAEVLGDYGKELEGSSRGNGSVASAGSDWGEQKSWVQILGIPAEIRTGVSRKQISDSAALGALTGSLCLLTVLGVVTARIHYE